MLDEFEKAITSFNKALDWDSKTDSDVHFYLALALFKLNDFEEAVIEIEKYIEGHSKDLVGYMLKDDINCAMAKPKIVQKMKNNYATKLLLKCGLNSGEFEIAAQHLQKIYNVEITDKWMLVKMIWACMQLKNSYNCSKVFEAYFNFDNKDSITNNSDMLYYSGIILYEVEKYNDAVIALHKVSKSGKFTDSLSYLSMIYYDLEEFEKAIFYAKKALEADNSNKIYKIRYEGILKYMKRKPIFGIFNKRPSSKKIWFYSR